MSQRTYIAIDLKSFYASVECRERCLDPLTTNLVVADERRTDKTICLAVTPSLKSYGIPGRPRLFEVIQTIEAVNRQRRRRAPGGVLVDTSFNHTELQAHPELAVTYLVAQPQMARYIEVSSRIYQVYLNYVAPEDIIVYSIDEVFLDVTHYLNTYQLSPRELAMTIILDVLDTTGITATAGIGTNLYLSKVAMDIVAKHLPADQNGVRIAELDERSYRETLWAHRPLTDFWRVGRGYAKKLEAHGMFTMGDIARRSLTDEDLLYRLFGKNAELLIDHAWGWEPCTIADVKAYRPATNSLSAGQVLHQPYPADKARLIVHEMTDLLALDLVEKQLVTDQLVLTIGYDRASLLDPAIAATYHGPVTTDHYGRQVPKHAHGTANLPRPTSSTRQLTAAMLALFDRIVNPSLLVRRVTIAANRVVSEHTVPAPAPAAQLDLFTDYEAEARALQAEEAARARERRAQDTILALRRKYGKNAVLKGINLQQGATTIERNQQVGGHQA